MIAARRPPSRALITGGGTLIGDMIALALLEQGVEVTLLVRPGAEARLGPLRDQVRWFHADIWEPSSLKGRARGQDVVIHTVGGLKADPAHGLTYHWLNVVSARNAANMCVSAGVPRFVLLSSARAPWLSGEYIKEKREAEAYLERVGLQAIIIRAPLVYRRGEPRSPFLALMTLLGGVPPFNWIGLRRSAPLPVDLLARGVAHIALDPRAGVDRRIYYAGDLRRRLSREERRQPLTLAALHAPGGAAPLPTERFVFEDDIAAF
ncbi:MAG: NAD-dependent epimerase/dehydratase family protein [Candidatus Flexifilum sp.]